ncbi:MAG: YgiT-type zinc finger protein [Acidobacteria bacterium]|nr:YgiT-type zinc finger protein [Acidobacteriota bacterium]
MKPITKLKQQTSSSEQKVCAYCSKQTARQVLLNQTFGHGDNMVVVENVATMICSNCGQSYFTGETLEKLDQILAKPESYACKQLVQVANFSQV